MGYVNVVTAPVVKVSIGAAGGNSVAQFLYEGSYLPAEVDADTVKDLRSKRMIKRIKVNDPEPEGVTVEDSSSTDEDSDGDEVPAE